MQDTGVLLKQDWPYVRPVRDEETPRKFSFNVGTISSLLAQLWPSATATEAFAMLSEVARQFSLPRLPVPELTSALLSCRAPLHPTVAVQAPVALQAATTAVRSDMSWRTFRTMRLHLQRLPLYQHDETFVSWLAAQPASVVQRWRRAFLPSTSPVVPASDVLQRLARLQPIPLEIGWEWHEAITMEAVANYAPPVERLAMDYVVSACLQRLDVYYLRLMTNFRRGAPSEQGLPEARERIHAPANGQLMISDAVFEEACSASDAALQRAQARATSIGYLQTPRLQSTAGSVFHRCAVCDSGAEPLTRTPWLSRFPPFALGCTCHFSFDIEGSPLCEADFEDELAMWARHRVRGKPYPHPSRLLLFKLAEESRLQR